MNEALHGRAMDLFDEGRTLQLRGAPEAAREKFEAAALLEEECVATVADDEPRSRGIVCVGAVSLFLRAGRLDHAEELVRRYTAGAIGPGFHRELLELLNEIRRTREALKAAPVEPAERATILTEALRKAEEDLREGKVRLFKIEG